MTLSVVNSIDFRQKYKIPYRLMFEEINKLFIWALSNKKIKLIEDIYNLKLIDKDAAQQCVINILLSNRDLSYGVYKKVENLYGDFHDSLKKDKDYTTDVLNYLYKKILISFFENKKKSSKLMKLIYNKVDWNDSSNITKIDKDLLNYIYKYNLYNNNELKNYIKKFNYDEVIKAIIKNDCFDLFKENFNYHLCENEFMINNLIINKFENNDKKYFYEAIKKIKNKYNDYERTVYFLDRKENSLVLYNINNIDKDYKDILIYLKQCGIYSVKKVEIEIAKEILINPENAYNFMKIMEYEGSSGGMDIIFTTILLADDIKTFNLFKEQIRKKLKLENGYNIALAKGCEKKEVLVNFFQLYDQKNHIDLLKKQFNDANKKNILNIINTNKRTSVNMRKIKI